MSDVKIKVIDSDKLINAINERSYDVNLSAVMALGALQAQPDSCDGCKYENADDGVLVPCGFCKRSHPDNYERRTDD